MNRLRCVLLLQLVTACAHGQATRQSQPPDPSKQAAALVQSFYGQVVSHETFGLYGAEWKVFAPYLSMGLCHKVEMTKSCGLDLARQDHSNPPQKSPFSMESGLLSGTRDDVASNRPSFAIERTEARQDGSFLVYVRLKQLWPPPAKPEIWEVAARVVTEKGHPVVDDVTYVYDEADKSLDESLSQLLTVPGCKGPRWIGH